MSELANHENEPKKPVLQALQSRTGSSLFERPIPVALTFFAFFSIALPLVVLRCIPNDLDVLPYLVLVEAVGLGTSHFFVTLAVYFEPDNLRHFRSSWRRRLIYFGLPLVILAALALQGALHTRERYPELSYYFFAGVRFFDFFHVGRQSAGVLQLWKRPLGAAVPSWTRHAENALFVGLALMQWQTFLLGGHFAGETLHAQLSALALAGLFVAIALQYQPLLADVDTRKPALLALGYLAVQALCAATAVYATWLYLTVLAVHYLEYHVLMAPRTFAHRSGVRAPVVLYSALAVTVVVFEARNDVVTDSVLLGLVVHVFDGIFLLHYVLDAFLWKFRDPYYRRVLSPLYFDAPVSRTASRILRPLTVAVALLAVTGIGVANSDLGRELHRLWIAPLQAEEHLRWGLALAREGQLRDAQHHIARAAELAPHDERLKTLLAAITRANTSR